MKAENKMEQICLGKIVGVHGIKGEVKVKSFTADDTDISAYGKLESKDGSKTFVLKVVGHSKELLRCKIKGIDDRNVAETLIGTELYVNRDVLPELDDEEYYLADLIGLKVFEQASENEVGIVAGVYNFGAGDILEIKVNATNKLEMLPFTKEYVPEVKVCDGYVKVSATLMNYAPDDEKEFSDEG